MTLQAALPRELYVDPAAFEREREQVLLREWTCVGRAADRQRHKPDQHAGQQRPEHTHHRTKERREGKKTK